MSRLLAAGLVLLALGALAGPVSACPKTTLADIEDEVMCPVCGTALELATEAPQAQRQRAYIEDLIADCRSKGEIKTALVAQFGDGVLALPGDDSGDGGFADVAVYAIPALALLLAAGGLAHALTRWRRSRAVASGAGTAAADAATGAAARLDDDLGRYDL